MGAIDAPEWVEVVGALVPNIGMNGVRSFFYCFWPCAALQQRSCLPKAWRSGRLTWVWVGILGRWFGYPRCALALPAWQGAMLGGRNWDGTEWGAFLLTTHSLPGAGLTK